MRKRPVFFADNIMLWEGLSYTPNHFWIDRRNDGWYRVGIDGFAAHVLGRADRVEFVAGEGRENPAARIDTGNAIFNLQFPEPLAQLRVKREVAIHPEWLTRYFFTSGWLFEGRSESDPMSLSSRYLTDATAGAWTRSELHRLTTFIHSRYITKDPELGAVMMDGGTPAPGVLRFLGHEEAMHLVREFFDPGLRKAGPTTG